MICAAIERCAGNRRGEEVSGGLLDDRPLDGEARVERRRFGTITSELESLRDWLKAEGITHVATTHTVDSSHVAMLSHPGLVIDVVRAAAKAVQATPAVA